MFKPKIAIVGAATGFVLSALAGMIGGNPMGVVLFRALLMAILFGGLTAVLSVVAIRFLPELEDIAPSQTEREDTGPMVDITVGDPGEPLDPFAQADRGVSDDGEQVPDFLMSGRVERPEMANQNAGVASAPQGPANGASGNVQEISPPQKGPAHRGPAQSGHSSGGLDVLPDLDDFVPVKRGGGEGDEEEAPEGFNAASILSDSRLSAGAGAGGDNDSATMAKAIRTILTREP